MKVFPRNLPDAPYKYAVQKDSKRNPPRILISPPPPGIFAFDNFFKKKKKPDRASVVKFGVCN